jgi:hypothetical protein
MVEGFHGRDDAAWTNTNGSAAERFRDDYSDGALGDLSEPLAELARRSARDAPTDEQLLPRQRRP